MLPLEFVDGNGEPIELAPGNTWIELAEAIPTDDVSNPDAAVVITPR